MALLIETSSGYGRTLLAGVARFLRVEPGWSVYLEQRDLADSMPEWLYSWTGDGILSRVTTPRLVESTAANGVALVDLTDRIIQPAPPQVRSDDEAIGRMGAAHLIERSFSRLAFCGYSGEAWSDRREASFRRAGEGAGKEVEVYRSPWKGPGVAAWEEERGRMEAWLARLAKPVGVMACNDFRGRHVLDACAGQGLAVPEEVAVVGVDNDELICTVSNPPLSSVRPNAEAVGYRAAEVLAAMMRGETPGEPVEVVPPVSVVARHSSDVVAIDDAEVAAAARTIRENACRGLTVEEVVAATAMARRTLERHFKRVVGRTLSDEIRLHQIKRARELLSTTDLPLSQISKLCGFDHPEYLGVVFKRMTGMTPGEHRRRAQGAE